MIQRYGQHVATALACLHEQQIAHLDVQPANIYLDDSPNGGVAKLALKFKTYKKHRAIAVAGGQCSEDIRNFGLTLLEAATGQLRKDDHFKPVIPTYIPPTLYDLLSDCLHPRPASASKCRRCR
eukprot:TRINITY_DN27502_c0_g1_i1.p2 TRINITY_DN27502_c0_g1~~TRINITY_DN27502_c0_g1_i1.p2  ORF type:complete len:124 (-),score=11.77 TRINITY_DN27502_c0_g1_i1:217-588(-)